jgi:hypothetical protein
VSLGKRCRYRKYVRFGASLMSLVQSAKLTTASPEGNPVDFGHVPFSPPSGHQ